MGLLRDRSGAFSPLLAISLLGLLAPAAWLAIRAANGEFSGPPLIDPGAPSAFGPSPGTTPFGPTGSAAFGAPPDGPAEARPITAAIHFTGDWAIRFLLLSLAVTPFRRLLHWPRLHLVRRRIGLAALAYAAGHLLLYAADQQFILSKIASEIALRIYLTIGFVALLGLIALGATSTDSAVRRMGAERWGRLHRLAYPIAGLAVLHFAMQSKLDISEPTLMWGLFLWGMGWRALQRKGYRAVSIAWLVGLAVAAALLTALSEAAWYGIATGVDPLRVLNANLSVRLGLRPCWLVLLFGLAAATTSLIGARRRGAPRARAPRPMARDGAAQGRLAPAGQRD
jgi:sulfoxide reductase heme-binding subunit YedZ